MSTTEDQRQSLRRTTLDLQDWANWRHQQTVQQLQKLKEESNGKQSQECQLYLFAQSMASAMTSPS